jgi:hypothetical protein
MGVVGGMVVYNAGTLAVLVHAGTGLGLSGSSLWPAALVHALMAAWCVATLRRPAATAMERWHLGLRRLRGADSRHQSK